MKIKLIGALVAAAALTTGCATEQARPQCLVSPGGFVVKYYPKDPAQTCGGINGVGEVLEFQKYPKRDDAPSSVATRVPRYVGQDYYDAYGDLAPGTESLGASDDFELPAGVLPAQEAAWRSGFSRGYDMNTNTNYGVGQFEESDEPDADNFCRVTDFEFSARAFEAEFPTADPANFVEEDGEWVLADDADFEIVQGRQEATYKFKNTAFYVTTQSPGLTFKADVTFTEEITGVGASSCSAEYTAIGMAPAYNVYGVPNVCSSDLDCDPCAFADDGSYIVGSGISPELDVVCDRDIYPGAHGDGTGFCFLRESDGGGPPELPSLLTTKIVEQRAANCRLRELGRGADAELDEGQQG